MGFTDERLRGVPIDAGIGNRDAIAQLGDGLGEWLAAGAQVAFDHRSDEALRAAVHLRNKGTKDLRLALRVLGGIVVGTVDEDRGREAGLGEERFRLPDMIGREVGAGGTAAQDDVAIRVAIGGDGRGAALQIDAEEGLCLPGGLDRVDRRLYISTTI